MNKEIRFVTSQKMKNKQASCLQSLREVNVFGSVTLAL